VNEEALAHWGAGALKYKKNNEASYEMIMNDDRVMMDTATCLK